MTASENTLREQINKIASTSNGYRMLTTKGLDDLVQFFTAAVETIPKATPDNKATLMNGWIMSHENMLGWNFARQRLAEMVGKTKEGESLE